ncbi:MAG TPA: hypothetical protein VNC61_15270 [Acidimicrobiales bacterium]|nr:hypothetical protein [Acidimicrobiales bacterium]
MINIATVHWQTDKWIDPQLHYVERAFDVPYRVFASLNGIDDQSAASRFHFAADLQGNHAAKLNELASIIARDSSPSDILIFLDGDAFPIRSLSPWVEQCLATFPLMAVRRDENLGDCQPHPSFCATTVGFWNTIEGDWRPGGTWVNTAGRQVVDTGGNLLVKLRDSGIEWLPLLRTNTYNPHPVWFGVYDHRIYHHGAGFQATRVERVDWASRYEKKAAAGRELRPTPQSPSLGMLRSRAAAGPGTLRGLGPGAIARATVKTVRLRLEHRHYVKLTKTERGRNLASLGEDVFRALSDHDDFFLRFDDTVLAVDG